MQAGRLRGRTHGGVHAWVLVSAGVAARRPVGGGGGELSAAGEWTLMRGERTCRSLCGTDGRGTVRVRKRESMHEWTDGRTGGWVVGQKAT